LKKLEVRKVVQSVPFSKEEEDWMDREVIRLCQTSAVEDLGESLQMPNQLRIMSKIRLAPKKEPKKFRLVINMQPLNSSLTDLHVKYEGLNAALLLLQKGWWMFKCDLKEGYFHVNMHPQSLPFMGFYWKKRWFRYNVLPFGLKHSPIVFSRLVRTLVKHWRSKGLLVIAYLDDFLFMAPTQLEAVKMREMIQKDFQELGWIWEDSKSVWEPTQRLEFLGLILDTRQGVLEVTPEKIQKTLVKIKSVLEKKIISGREIASLAGSVISLARAFAPARLYTRNFYSQLKGFRKKDLDWDSQVCLTQESLGDAKWISENLVKFKASTAWKPAQWQQLSTDSSLTGWGFSFQKLQGGSHWTEEAHINLLELKAVLWSLISIQSMVKGQNLHILSDSQVAVAYLKNGGGQSMELTSVVKQIWTWSVEWEVDLVGFEWIPGVNNKIPDFQSRLIDHFDWRVDKICFQQLDQRWGPHTVDRMASDLNYQIKRFNSMRFCPGTEAVNCFTQDWSKENNWVVPPFNLIHRILKLIIEQGAKATLVAPQWEAQVWWPILQSILVDSQPIPFQYCLTGPSGSLEPKSSWTIQAFRVNGLLAGKN
jgi:hypothetical protein